MGLGRAELVVGLQLLNWLKKPLRWSAEEAGCILLHILQKSPRRTNWLVDSSVGCYYAPSVSKRYSKIRSR